MRATALSSSSGGGKKISTNKRLLLLLSICGMAVFLMTFRTTSDISPAESPRLFLTKAQVRDAATADSASSSSSSSSSSHTIISKKVLSNMPASSVDAVAAGTMRQPLLVQPLLPKHVMELLNRADNMVDLTTPRVFDKSKCPVEPSENELPSNIQFLDFFTKVFREKFDNLPWMLDEGGLIGASRAGAMKNADDDFDFFLILPNNHAPCRPDSLTCTEEEFHHYIHKFLMVFWDLGLCINKFNPDKKKFKSKMRLMYSLQLNRPAGVDPEHCFIEEKPFAHMHLGMFTEEGLLQTNIWAVHTTHARDKLPLNVLLPTSRCRIGLRDAPCPNNITEYLTIRNRGEYRKRAADGVCLLVKNRWKPAVKKAQVEKTLLLERCGYNSIVDLVAPFVASDYKTC